MCQLSIFFVSICILHFISIASTSNDSNVRNETIIEVQQHHNIINDIKVDDYIPDFIRIKFDSLYIIDNQTSSHDHELSSHKKTNNKSKDNNFNNINDHINNEDSNINNKNDIDMKTKHVGNDENQYDDMLRSSSRTNDGSSNDNDADDSRQYYNDGNKKLQDEEKKNYDGDTDKNNNTTENKRRKSDNNYDSNTNTAKGKHNDNDDESIQDNDESIQGKRFKSTTSNDDRLDIDYEEEIRRKKHAETLRLRKIREREIEGEKAVKRTIQAGSSEQCDWKSQPLAIIKGMFFFSCCSVCLVN